MTRHEYLPACESLRMLNSSGNEPAVGGPTVMPSPLTTLLPSEFNQVKIGVLWIPSMVVAEHRIPYMFPAIAFPIGKMDDDMAVAGTVIKTNKYNIAINKTSIRTLTVYNNGNSSLQYSIGCNCSAYILSVVQILLYGTEHEVSLLVARTYDHIAIKDPLQRVDIQIT